MLKYQGMCMCPVSVDTWTVVHFKMCSKRQPLFNHNFRIIVVARNYVSVLELCCVHTQRHLELLRRGIQITWANSTSPHVCLFVWTDITTEMKVGICFVATRPRCYEPVGPVGFSRGTCLLHHATLTSGGKWGLLRTQGRMSLFALRLNPSWILRQRGSDRKNMPPSWETERRAHNNRKTLKTWGTSV